MKKSLLQTACEDELLKREFARRAGLSVGADVRRRRSLVTSTPATWQHGYSGYCNHHCRCDVCRQGWRERWVQYRKKWKARAPQTTEPIIRDLSDLQAFRRRHGLATQLLIGGHRPPLQP